LPFIASARPIRCTTACSVSPLPRGRCAAKIAFDSIQLMVPRLGLKDVGKAVDDCLQKAEERVEPGVERVSWRAAQSAK
jgi:predicted exporter